MPYHYTLGKVGHLIRCAARGDDPARRRYHPASERWLRSQQLQHRLVINEFFTQLLGDGRRSDGTRRLDKWWSESRCTKAMAGLVHPDGYGVWRDGAHTTEFCLEVDRSTEERHRVARKLKGYHDLQLASGVRRWTLFCFTNERRERNVRQVLVGAEIPIATTTHCSAPHGRVWMPLTESSSRFTLTELGRSISTNANSEKD